MKKSIIFLICLFLATSAFAKVKQIPYNYRMVGQDALVGMWIFQEASGTLYDQTANNYYFDSNSLTLSYQAEGKIDYGISCTATYACRVYPDFRPSDSSGTFMCWAKFNAPMAAINCIFSSSDTSTNAQYLLMLGVDAGSKVNVFSNNGGTLNRINTTVAIDTAVWNHIAWVSTGTEYKVYVNGVDMAMMVGAGVNNGDWLSDITLRDGFCIGSLHNNSTITYMAYANISDARLYSRALSQAEIVRDYDWGKPSRMIVSIQPQR